MNVQIASRYNFRVGVPAISLKPRTGSYREPYRGVANT